MRVLLIEQDAALGRILADRLRQDRFEVDWTSNLQAADASSESIAYAALVLDLGSIANEALAVLETLRERDARLPIIVIGNRAESRQNILALDAGADDYLVKPIDPDELAARMRALLRRIEQRPRARVSVGRVQLDPVRRIVTRDGLSVPLTASEYCILAVLLTDPGRLVTRATLEQQLYGLGDSVPSNSLEVHIHHLRRKLGERFIQNVRGRGYRVKPDGGS